MTVNAELLLRACSLSLAFSGKTLQSLLFCSFCFFPLALLTASSPLSHQYFPSSSSLSVPALCPTPFLFKSLIVFLPLSLACCELSPLVSEECVFQWPVALSHVTCVFGHAEAECLCDVNICTPCCSAVGRGKEEGVVRSGGERLTEGRQRHEGVGTGTSSNTVVYATGE